MRVLSGKFLPIYIAIILSAFYGCGTASYNGNLSYAPEDAGKNVSTSSLYSHSRSSRLLNGTSDDIQPVESVKLKKNIDSKKYSGIGPILNKISARDAINSYRKKHGLKPLKSNKKLEKVAHGHSRDMAQLDKVSHIGSDGSDPWDRIEKSGYKLEMATENVGAGLKKFEKLFSLWKASKVHNANLLVSDATDMGLALVHDKSTQMKTFWTLVIAKKAHTKTARKKAQRAAKTNKLN